MLKDDDEIKYKYNWKNYYSQPNYSITLSLKESRYVQIKNTFFSFKNHIYDRRENKYYSLKDYNNEILLKSF